MPVHIQKEELDARLERIFQRQGSRSSESLIANKIADGPALQVVDLTGVARSTARSGVWSESFVGAPSNKTFTLQSEEFDRYIENTFIHIDGGIGNWEITWYLSDPNVVRDTVWRKEITSGGDPIYVYPYIGERSAQITQPPYIVEGLREFFIPAGRNFALRLNSAAGQSFSGYFNAQWREVSV